MRPHDQVKAAAITIACAMCIRAVAATPDVDTVTSVAGARPPNFVLILTDDQDLLLDSMQAMPFTTQLMSGTGGGATFSNFFAHVPVCCPSRATLLSSRYMHNARTSTADPAGGTPTCMHVNASDDFQNHEIFVRALNEQLGYRTQLSGKYFNTGGMAHICPAPVGKTTPPKLAPPPGWTRLAAQCPDTCYTNCLFVDNGKSRWFNDSTFHTPGGNYAPSVIGNMTVDFIQESMDAQQPFFAMAAPHSPHGPATPAPWYADAFPSFRAPRTPAYNVSSPDAHWAVAGQPAIDDKVEAAMDELARNRLRTLLSVDDIVREAHAAVVAAGQENNTYWLMSSDHGFHMGTHRLGPCKRQPFETDVRVPFYIAGPGISPGQTISAPAGLPDIGPTVLQLAGADPAASGLVFDGRSLAPFVTPTGSATPRIRGGHAADADAAPPTPRSYYPIEYFATSEAPVVSMGHVKDNGNNTFRGVRVFRDALQASVDYAYFEFTDYKADWEFKKPSMFELYDVAQDPHQLNNLYPTCPDDLREWLASLVAKAWSCRGSSCDFVPVNDVDALPQSETTPAVSAIVDAPPPARPVWPDAFKATFDVTVAEAYLFAAPSTLYYDWTLRRQRVDFGACSANETPGPCTTLFTSNTTFLIQDDKCCITATIGVLEPTWVSNLEFNGTRTVGTQVQDWWRGATPVHNYFVDPSTQQPSFLLVEDIEEQWAFTSPLQAGPQDPSLFDVPAQCKSATSC